MVPAIGEDRTASDVLALLYRQPYRILHISAHGVFDLPHADGLRRSGVVLSDGLLITAAEIDAMEIVPELVFLSCCHLGKVDKPDGGRDERTVRDGNKLAASVARELIEIGVRCVVVAGWAVDDQQAKLFGETFYQRLMLQRQPFGEAVHAAREALWKASPRTSPGAHTRRMATPAGGPSRAALVMAVVTAAVHVAGGTARRTREGPCRHVAQEGAVERT